MFESEQELVESARRLAGRSVGELCADLALEPPTSGPRAKGFIGRLIEQALGATSGSNASPDFPSLGIELKTLPVSSHGRPSESTFVAHVPIGKLAHTDWKHSIAYRKLRRVLWVPIESAPKRPLTARSIGTAFLWSPSPEEESLLRTDWNEASALAGLGRLEELTGHLGDILQFRPKAANGRARTLALGEDGPIWIMPRGCYLRATFTAMLVRRAFPTITHQKTLLLDDRKGD